MVYAFEHHCILFPQQNLAKVIPIGSLFSSIALENDAQIVKIEPLALKPSRLGLG